MTSKILLEVKDLETKFRNETETVTAVDKVSFTISRGETVGIVGESGSGKSATALSIMRLIPKASGRITGGEIIYNFESQPSSDLIQLPENEMRKLRGNFISMIFQEPMTSLNPVYTCGDQVMEAILLHQKCSKKEAKEKTLELFKQVQLPRPVSLFERYPHQVSGGQKQRVMIAMAMSCHPCVLIADEPTTALDVTVQATILDLMRKLQVEYNMGILFISHDLNVIAELADKVIVMYKGKIVEQGKVADIFTNPQHPYTKGLLACRPQLDKRLRVLPTISDFMEIDGGGEIVESTESISELTEKLVVTKEERQKAHKELYSREPILRVKNLKTYFPIKGGMFKKVTDYVTAVDDVTFDVYPGETLGLVGESGCGKSTLGRSILRLIEPTSGEIIFRDRHISNISSKELRLLRKDMQIIFQDPYSSLNPRLTVSQAIMEPMQVHQILANDKARTKQVLELLNRVNMDKSYFHRYPHELSGGQRQRVCIARALALNPKFIICDESVSALDASVQAQVLNLLNELKKEYGFTYIFISHDLSVVKFMSDRMMVMNKGQIVEMGDADDIYYNPQTDYTKKLISSIPKGNFNHNKTIF
jgi:peptide/nickel transport system ATP-binding protein